MSAPFSRALFTASNSPAMQIVWKTKNSKYFLEFFFFKFVHSHCTTFGGCGWCSVLVSLVVYRAEAHAHCTITSPNKPKQFAHSPQLMCRVDCYFGYKFVSFGVVYCMYDWRESWRVSSTSRRRFKWVECTYLIENLMVLSRIENEKWNDGLPDFEASNNFWFRSIASGRRKYNLHEKLVISYVKTAKHFFIGLIFFPD